MNQNALLKLLESIKDGSVSPDDGALLLKNFLVEDLSFAKIDHHRVLRRGLPEVVFGEGKTPDQILSIANSLKNRGTPVLITRLDHEKWETIHLSAPYLGYSNMARCAYYREAPANHPGKILICAAGTSDLPVAEEAAVTLETMGHPVSRLTDIGVAGLHRLLGHLDELQTANIIIAVAGMEGALPSVIAGVVDCPVIGVPTSIGYGASFAGVSALLSMLNSCASGVTVVNIDNGFGAAYAAALMIRKQYQTG